jgi:phosphoserine aminotransferase
MAAWFKPAAIFPSSLHERSPESRPRRPATFLAERVFNFSPGPAALPTEVLHQAAEEMLSWRGTGVGDGDEPPQP